jgi:hypothetical protein
LHSNKRTLHLNSTQSIASSRSPLWGQLRQARCSTPAALVRVRAPLFKETSLRAGFCLSTDSPSNSFDYSPKPLTLWGQRDKRAENASALVRVRAPLFKETSLRAGFLLSKYGLSIELRSIIRGKPLTPSGPATSALFNACGVSPSPGTTI